MSNEKTKLIFIACPSRSGSTILGNVLGQASGAVHVGEVMHIWDRGIHNNWLCSCGRSFSECEFWQKVIAQAFRDGLGTISDRMMECFKKKLIRVRDILSNSGPSFLGKVAVNCSNEREILLRLYTSIKDVSGKTIIIDSSGTPSYGLLLKNLDGFQFYIIHLIRDPRAVAFSRCVRKKKQPIGKGVHIEMGNITFGESIRDWLVSNSLIEKLFKWDVSSYLSVRYEDFCRSPFQVVSKILNSFGVAREGLEPLKNKRFLNMGNHVFSGNPVRFGNKEMKIVEDLEWKRKMNKLRKIQIEISTIPFLWRYGYLRGNMG